MNKKDALEIAYALAWKYGPVVSTKNGVIIKWTSAQPQPDPSEFSNIVKDYRDYLDGKKVAKSDRKKAVMTKLGIAKSDIKGLKELIEDGNDD